MIEEVTFNAELSTFNVQLSTLNAQVIGTRGLRVERVFDANVGARTASSAM